MGYKKTAQELENESGIKCQSSHVSDILNAIVQGDWTLAIEQVNYYFFGSFLFSSGGEASGRRSQSEERKGESRKRKKGTE